MLVLPRSTLIVVMMMLYMTREILESVDPSITFTLFQFDAEFLLKSKGENNVKHTFFPAIFQDSNSNSKHKFFSDRGLIFLQFMILNFTFIM